MAARVGSIPVSTTHALIGALIGAGLVAAPGQVQAGSALGGFVLPLLLVPLAGSNRWSAPNAETP